MKITKTCTPKQLRELAVFFLADASREGAYIWRDGSLHEESQPGEDFPHYVSRLAPLPYATMGDWATAVNFMDKLMEEDFTWELARRGVGDESVLFPIVSDRL